MIEIPQNKSNGRVFFAWLAFVLLPVNLFVGNILASNHSWPEFWLSLFVGTGVTFFLSAPAVVLAQTRGMTFAEGIGSMFSGTWATVLTVTVPIVNVGWYAIQTAAAAEALSVFTENAFIASPAALAFSIVFALGPILFGFSWLARAGGFACIALAGIGGWALLSQTGSQAAPAPATLGVSWAGVLEGSLLVLGTWVFSSTTCVMDVARFGANVRGTLIAVFTGLLLANSGLIVLGFALGHQDPQSGVLGILLGASALPGFLFLVLALWSTNDSNLYSTMQALKGIRLPPRISGLVAALIAGAAAAHWGGELFGFIGSWLKLMGWVGLLFGSLWWFSLFSAWKSK